MNRVHLLHLGRTGNNIFAYAFARGYCDRHLFTLHTDPWSGEQVFDIEHPRCADNLPRRDENNLVDGESEISYRSYSQRQKCADYYSLDQIATWLKFRPDVERILFPLALQDDAVVCHMRRGDYRGYGYPLVSRASYITACEQHGLDSKKIVWVSDDTPVLTNEFHGELQWVPDFYRMAKSMTLLRANSSFSFWAGALVEANGGRVFSPEIAGRIGGVEHEVPFVAGNGARIADFDFVEPIIIPR